MWNGTVCRRNVLKQFAQRIVGSPGVTDKENLHMGQAICFLLEEPLLIATP